MIGDAREHGREIRLRIESVEPGRTDQAVDQSRALTAGIGTGEQVVLAAERHGPDRPFGGVVVDLDAAVVDIAHQCRPTRERVLDRRRQRRLPRYLRECRLQPGLEGRQPWTGPGLAGSAGFNWPLDTGVCG